MENLESPVFSNEFNDTFYDEHLRDLQKEIEIGNELYCFEWQLENIKVMGGVLVKLEEIDSYLSRIDLTDCRLFNWALQPSMVALVQCRFMEHPHRDEEDNSKPRDKDEIDYRIWDPSPVTRNDSWSPDWSDGVSLVVEQLGFYISGSGWATVTYGMLGDILFLALLLANEGMPSFDCILRLFDSLIFGDRVSLIVWDPGICMTDALLFWVSIEWLHITGHIFLRIAHQPSGATSLRLVWDLGILVIACRYQLLEGKQSLRREDL